MNKSKEQWTSIGCTVEIKERFAVMKESFEKMLDLGSKTWDYFLKALLDLGPLTWNFLITESVKGIRASMQSCPLPNTSFAQEVSEK